MDQLTSTANIKIEDNQEEQIVRNELAFLNDYEENCFSCDEDEFCECPKCKVRIKTEFYEEQNFLFVEDSLDEESEELAAITGITVEEQKDILPNQLSVDPRDEQLRGESHHTTNNEPSTSPTSTLTNSQFLQSRKYECPVCYMTFQRMVSLNNHKRIHGNNSVLKDGESSQDFSSSAAECSKTEGNNDNITSVNSLINSVQFANESINRSNKPICQFCNRICFSFSHLTIHIRKHTGECPYPCPTCNKAFNQKGNLTRHMRVFKHGYERTTMSLSHNTTGQIRNNFQINKFKQRHRCHLCTKSFKTKGNLKNHLKAHFRRKQLNNTQTHQNAQFETIENRVEEEDKDKDESIVNKECPAKKANELHECDTCFDTFQTKSTLIRHIKTHTNRQPFLCDHCDKCFTEHSKLVEHSQIHNRPTKKFRCEQCPKSFSEKCNLKIHTLFCHKPSKPTKPTYHCKMCRREFASNKARKIHARFHNMPKIKKFQQSFKSEFLNCSICGKRFNGEYQLTVHLRTHQSFRCSQCTSSFSTLAALDNHNISCHREKPASSANENSKKTLTSPTKPTVPSQPHIEEKLFRCTLCGVGFNSKGGCQRHQKRGCGKTYKCPTCNMAYARVTDLIKHRLTHRSLAPV